MEDIIKSGDLRVLADESSCDVVLSCQGFKLMAHRIILSIASPLLQDLLQEHNSQPTVIIFPEITATTMTLILDYIYSGQVTLKSSQMPDFLAVSNLLKLKAGEDYAKMFETKEDCTKIFKSFIEKSSSDDKTCGDYLKVVKSCANEDHLKSCVDYMKVFTNCEHSMLEGYSNRFKTIDALRREDCMKLFKNCDSSEERANAFNNALFREYYLRMFNSEEFLRTWASNARRNEGEQLKTARRNEEEETQTAPRNEEETQNARRFEEKTQNSRRNEEDAKNAGRNTKEETQNARRYEEDMQTAERNADETKTARRNEEENLIPTNSEHSSNFQPLKPTNSELSSNFQPLKPTNSELSSKQTVLKLRASPLEETAGCLKPNCVVCKCKQVKKRALPELIPIGKSKGQSGLLNKVFPSPWTRRNETVFEDPREFSNECTMKECVFSDGTSRANDSNNNVETRNTAEKILMPIFHSNKDESSEWDKDLIQEKSSGHSSRRELSEVSVHVKSSGPDLIDCCVQETSSGPELVDYCVKERKLIECSAKARRKLQDTVSEKSSGLLNFKTTFSGNSPVNLKRRNEESNDSLSSRLVVNLEKSTPFKSSSPKRVKQVNSKEQPLNLEVKSNLTILPLNLDIKQLSQVKITPVKRKLLQETCTKEPAINLSESLKSRMLFQHIELLRQEHLKSRETQTKSSRPKLLNECISSQDTDLLKPVKSSQLTHNLDLLKECKSSQLMHDLNMLKECKSSRLMHDADLLQKSSQLVHKKLPKSRQGINVLQADNAEANVGKSSRLMQDSDKTESSLPIHDTDLLNVAKRVKTKRACVKKASDCSINSSTDNEQKPVTSLSLSTSGDLELRKLNVDGELEEIKDRSSRSEESVSGQKESQTSELKNEDEEEGVIKKLLGVERSERETNLIDQKNNADGNAKEKKYKCQDCGKGFSQLRNYKYHRSIHEGSKKFSATCPECGKVFNDRGYLSSHMKIHRDRKEYACQHCPKRFNQRVAYNMHLRIHTGVKPHACADCGKSFSRKMLLKQHQRVHTGERPYACKECGKSFADRSNMSLHARLHTGVKPYSCTMCPKSFTKKHHLKTHMNFHMGIKPYTCEKCGLAFSQSSNMRTHYKKCILKNNSDNSDKTEENNPQ